MSGRSVGLLAALLVAACTGSPTPAAVSSPTVTPAASAPPTAPPTVTPSVTPTVTPSVTAAPAVLACPAAYAAPDPGRPVLTAAVSFGSGGVVTGTERVVFRPDLPTGQVVLRLWAAEPAARAAGGGITVTSVTVNGVRRVPERPAPTLLKVPLAGRTTPGRPVTVDVAFRIQLPTGANERFGHRGDTAWFGSGLPLLAWVRGHGWATEPETAQFAEAATSEAMRLASLRVTRAAGLTVLATGATVSDDGRTATLTARSVRDVAVAVGRFRTATALAAHKTVLVGVAPGVPDDPVATARALARAVAAHAARFGPFPYERLVAAVLPDLRGGIEYPGAILLGTGQTKDATASHEVAHQWWYGLVGDDQARDPWLDEAFATYAEALDRGTAARYLSLPIPADARDRVGAPMTYWAGRSSYFRGVYVQGAAALLRARARVGGAAFDRALVCHVRRNAHRVTTPADLARSLAGLPAALSVLRSYGALP
jgi:hypothetical protein